MATQKENILAHLKSGRSITPAKALAEYGVWRLSAIIYQLKKEGYDIVTELKRSPAGKPYAEYTLQPKVKRYPKLKAGDWVLFKGGSNYDDFLNRFNVLTKGEFYEVAQPEDEDGDIAVFDNEGEFLYIDANAVELPKNIRVVTMQLPNGDFLNT